MLDLRLSWEFIGSASGEYGTAHSAQLASLQLLVCGGSPTDKSEIIREMTLPLAFEHLIIAPTGCSLLLAMLARELWHRVEPAAQAQ